MAYDTQETLEWLELVGLAVCGAPVRVAAAISVVYACQREPGHEGWHDPR